MSRAQAFFLVCFALSCYFVYSAASGALRSHRVSSEEAEAGRQVAELRQRMEHLEAVFAYVASDGYVEQEARRRLGYVREGEVPVVVISPAPPARPAKEGQWWERLFPR